MDCRECRAILAERALASAGPALPREVEGHLAGCVACRDDRASFGPTVARVGFMSAGLSEAALTRVRAGVLAALRGGRTAPAAGRPESAIGRRSELWLRVAAAALLGLIGARAALDIARVPAEPFPRAEMRAGTQLAGTVAQPERVGRPAGAGTSAVGTVARPEPVGRPGHVELRLRSEERGITVVWVFDRDVEYSLAGAGEEPK